MTRQHTLVDAARNRAPGHASATSGDAVDAIFAGLVCADPDLLRLEFDAITANLSPTGTGQRHRCPPFGDRRSQPAGDDHRWDRAGPGPTTPPPIPLSTITETTLRLVRDDSLAGRVLVLERARPARLLDPA
jgi:hypothetical protein